MKVDLDINEVIKIAVSIEINGENIYREAALRATDINWTELFNELADMEKDHARYFSSILRDVKLNNEEIVEISDEDNAKKLADKIAKGIFRQIPEKAEDMKLLLDHALQTEKLSIELYSTIKKVYPKLIKEDDIDLIIQEEENHVNAVQKAMAEYFSSTV